MFTCAHSSNGSFENDKYHSHKLDISLDYCIDDMNLSKFTLNMLLSKVIDNIHCTTRNRQYISPPSSQFLLTDRSGTTSHLEWWSRPFLFQSVMSVYNIAAQNSLRSLNECSVYGLLSATWNYLKYLMASLRARGWRGHQLDQCTGIVVIYADDCFICGDEENMKLHKAYNHHVRKRVPCHLWPQHAETERVHRRIGNRHRIMTGKHNRNLDDDLTPWQHRQVLQETHSGWLHKLLRTVQPESLSTRRCYTRAQCERSLAAYPWFL